MTDQQLRALFPKLLPERVHMHLGNEMLCWLTNPHNRVNDNIQVQNNQLLSLCRKVEETLTKDERIKYIELLWKKSPSYVKDGYNWNQAALANLIWWTLAHASWEQRIQAAAEVGGFV